MAGLDYDTTPPTFVEAVGTGAESGSEAEPSDLQRRHSENLDEVKVEHIDDVYDVDSVKPTHVLQSLRARWALDYLAILEMRD